MKIVHLSDIHIWKYEYRPFHLFGKRIVGIASLAMGRARKFRLERLSQVVDRVLSTDPDQILITGDLTTTALKGEFREANRALEPLLKDPDRVTIIPGNHDRYTGHSVRSLAFEKVFGHFAPTEVYPWLKHLDGDTAILGLDATRSHLSARGHLPIQQLESARKLLEDPEQRPNRLIIACHYPVAAPPSYQRELHDKRMNNAELVKQWLSGIGPHIYCCGHVHAAWAFSPEDLPEQLCLNSGAPLLRDPTGRRPPGFLEIQIAGQQVSVVQHAWTGQDWSILPMVQARHLFNQPSTQSPESSRSSI